MKKLKIRIWFENGTITVEVQKGTSISELIIASFELHKKALSMSTEKYIKG